MTVTLTLNPEVEKGLMERARERGLSLNDYLQGHVAREAGLLTAKGTSGEENARAFVQWAESHRYAPRFPIRP